MKKYEYFEWLIMNKYSEADIQSLYDYFFYRIGKDRLEDPENLNNNGYICGFGLVEAIYYMKEYKNYLRTKKLNRII